MLKHQLIHPKINEVLGRAGHHARVLIADGNYPSSTAIGPRAELVCLNLSPGIVTCTQVLRALLSAIPIEAVQTMMYETSGPYALDNDPPVWDEYRKTDSPERYLAVCGLMLWDMQLWKDKDLGWIERKMSNIERRPKFLTPCVGVFGGVLKPFSLNDIRRQRAVGHVHDGKLAECTKLTASKQNLVIEMGGDQQGMLACERRAPRGSSDFVTCEHHQITLRSSLGVF